MTFVLLSSLAVGLPFIIERFVLKHRFGMFALLFWVFVAQGFILGCATLLAGGAPGDGGFLERIGAFVAGVTLLTIGLTPFAALALAVVFTTIWGFERLFQGSRGKK